MTKLQGPFTTPDTGAGLCRGKNSKCGGQNGAKSASCSICRDCFALYQAERKAPASATQREAILTGPAPFEVLEARAAARQAASRVAPATTVEAPHPAALARSRGKTVALKAADELIAAADAKVAAAHAAEDWDGHRLAVAELVEAHRVQGDAALAAVGKK